MILMGERWDQVLQAGEIRCTQVILAPCSHNGRPKWARSHVSSSFSRKVEKN